MGNIQLQENLHISYIYLRMRKGWESGRVGVTLTAHQENAEKKMLLYHRVNWCLFMQLSQNKH